jgi:hypothetical protein
MKSLLITTLICALAEMLNAQVKTDFNNGEQIGTRGKYSKNFRGKNPYVIPARDIKVLLRQDSLEILSSKAIPFKIAKALPVNINVVKEAEWVEEDGMAYGKFTLMAASAKSVSANFDQFFLPEGTELYVYSQNGEMITGPVTEKENNENSLWGTWVYKGGFLTIDLKTPIVTKSNLNLHISSIAYGFKDIYEERVANFGESEACNVNVICAGTAWENERNSVALILDANSEALCSGVLVNNTCNLNIPYLLTANHCFETNPQQNVAHWKFTFQAWSPTCTPSQNANGVTFNGSTLRARNAASDFCLVELSQMPPANSNITFAGWNRSNVAAPNATGIHHPNGDVMKISQDNDPIVRSGGGFFNNATHWEVRWNSGITAVGSSGSPLFDNNRRIIGQLHGGTSFCSTPTDPDWYGSFDQSWTGGGTNATRLSNWLDPSNIGSMTTNSRAIMSVTGPTLICTTGSFALQNPPVGLPVVWSSSNQAILTIDPSSGVAVRQSNQSGQVTIAATLNAGCGSSIEKNVWVGDPSLTYVPPGPNPCTSNPYYYGPPTEGLSYQWTIDNPNVWLVTPSTSVFATVLSHDPEYFNLTLTISDGTCSTSTTLFSYTDGYYCQCFFPPCGGGFLRFAVSPNPASSQVEIRFDEKEYEKEVKKFNAVNYSVGLIDERGNALSEINISDKSYKWDTSKLPAGTYYLKIKYRDLTETKRVIINH